MLVPGIVVFAFNNFFETSDSIFNLDVFTGGPVNTSATNDWLT